MNPDKFWFWKCKSKIITLFYQSTGDYFILLKILLEEVL